MAPRMSRRRELFGRLGLAVGSLLACVLLAEGALRAAGYRPERHRTRIRLTTASDLTVRAGALVLDCYPSDPAGSFDLDLANPEVRRRYESEGVRGLEQSDQFPHAVEFRYNAAGFRGPEFPPRRPGVRRVAVVGDSFTEGQGAREADTYVRQLEALLNAREPGGWEVLNFGWRALDFPKLRDTFEQALAQQPDLVVFGMVLNDGERSPAFDRKWPQLNDWIMVRRPPESPSLLRPRLVSFVRDRLETARIARDTTGWYRDMYGPANAEGWQRTREDLRRMQQAARERDVPLLVALWPLLVDLEKDYPFADVHDKIGRACERAGAPFVDLLPVLRGRPSSTLWAHPADWHPNALAHRLVADALAPRVRAAATR
jgi:lysophospholipase L1-like esterase